MENDNEFYENDSHENLLRKRKHYEKRLEDTKFRWWHAFLIIILSGFISYAAWLIDGKIDNGYNTIMIYAGFGFFWSTSLIYSFYLAIRLPIKRKLRLIEFEIMKFDRDELKENLGEDFFTKLIQINFKYLDQYYLQTQEQASKSFNVSLFAGGFGLLVIVFGICMMFFNKTTPGYVTTTVGVLSEFIAAVFFYLYNRTILKMSEYHKKLVITQNIGIALKISDDLEGDARQRSKEVIIDRLTIDTNKYLSSN